MSDRDVMDRCVPNTHLPGKPRLSQERNEAEAPNSKSPSTRETSSSNLHCGSRRRTTLKLAGWPPDWSLGIEAYLDLGVWILGLSITCRTEHQTVYGQGSGLTHQDPDCIALRAAPQAPANSPSVAGRIFTA